MPVTVVPFDAGQHQGISKNLLPTGTFALLENGQLDRDGRLRVRAGFAQVASTTYGIGTFVGYDLYSYNDRLLALGDRTALGFPTDLFEFTQGYGAKAWRPTDPDNTLPRLPRTTRVRDIGSPSEQEGGLTCFGCAASAGYCTLVYNNNDTLGTGFAHVFNPVNDQTLCFLRIDGSGATQPKRNIQAVGLDTKVVILGLDDAAAQLNAKTFTYATSTAFSGAIAGIFASTTIQHFAACRVTGADQFAVVVGQTNGDLIVKRFSNTAVDVGVSYGIKHNGVGSLVSVAIEADVTANVICIVAIVGFAMNAYLFNLTTGADIGSGPFTTATLSGKTALRVGICREDAFADTICVDVTSDTEPSIYIFDIAMSTGVLSDLGIIRDAQMASNPIEHASEVVLAIRYGVARKHQSTNQLVSHSRAPTDNRLTPQIGKDLEIADSTSFALPTLTQDLSTGKYYWANAIVNKEEVRPGTTNNSVDAQPLVTEFLLGSPDRRQAAQLGNELYIAGGCPTLFDGRQLFESGYHMRPRIISVTPSTATGSLLPLAQYDYVGIWEATDADRNIHRSAISTISNVTMGATDNTNTIVMTSPHSLRCNTGVFNSGGSVRLKLFRSFATVTNIAATLLGTKSVDPPDTSLNLSTLGIQYHDTVAGSFFLSVTFGAGDNNSATIAATINASSIGTKLVATAEGSLIRLTAILTGSTASFYVDAGSITTGATLGYATGSKNRVSGSTNFSKGQNLQLCATASIGANSRPGSFVTLVDTLADSNAGLASQEILYTQVISPLSNFAPPPHDYVWAGKERLNTGGQPKRDQWTVSKLISQGDPVNFAFNGQLGFSNRVAGDIQAVLVEGDSNTYFTRRKIWRISGRGPETNGQGEFFAADEVDSTGGVRDNTSWKSLVKISDGTFFQLADDKLYLLHPGGIPEWIGQPVRDTLAAFPNIVAAAHFSQRQAVVFACQNTAGNDGKLLVYDLRRKIWSQDNIGPVTALAEFNGRVAYLLGGNVFLEDLTPGVSGNFIPFTVTLGSFIGFGPMGWGSIQKILLLGVYRGDVNIEAQISYDDGKTFVTMGNFDVTTANGYVQDAPVQLEFAPAVQECSRFALRFLQTRSGSATEGVWLNALELHHSQNVGANKLGGNYTR